MGGVCGNLVVASGLRVVALWGDPAAFSGGKKKNRRKKKKGGEKKRRSATFSFNLKFNGEEKFNSKPLFEPVA